jgi:hypothetical protein
MRNHITEPRTGTERTIRAQTAARPAVSVLFRAMLTRAAMKRRVFRIRRNPKMPILPPEIAAAADA